ncbi:hypothetical protein SV7mr_46220 [Stieleria bergensis]|uniref:Uncharacterized protein n=1 Tax=Stieleria bergensis TaxID=2528025 RepID=A0A517T110_9BACT|nr:hypothetical protein SV7mr_46220 [Planctomycetes bacterium SV_7m_r]
MVDRWDTPSLDGDTPYGRSPYGRSFDVKLPFDFKLDS